MAQLTISCLGQFTVTLNGRAITADFDTEKTRALLAYLAVEIRRPQHRERLAGLFWSDQPEERALHSLRQRLSQLRKILCDESLPVPFLLIERDAIQLNPDSNIWIDVQAYAQALDLAYQHYRGQSQQGCLNIRALQQAIALYQGPFIDQMYLSGSEVFDEWVSLQREEYNQRAVEGLALLAGYHERRGEYSLARQTIARILNLTPWDEGAHAQMMRLLAIDGQWSAAQNQYAVLRRYLDEQLGVEPANTTLNLFTEIREAAAQNAPIPAPQPLALSHLPDAPTQFVGRDVELDLLAQLIADPNHRLLTLLGAGGVGKTRLAVQAAREQVGLFTDGVYLIRLAAVPASDLLASAIADALGFKFFRSEDPRTQLINYLREKTMLLILDNFEHLVDSADLIVDLMLQAPAVTILVTSRLPLSLRAERVLEIEGLDLEHAVQLFDQIARRLQPRFNLSEAWPLVERICRLLDCLPLGIELAASWIRTHDCQVIAEQIAADPDFLSTGMRDVPERHRSLRAVFEHSWQLLPRPLQEIFSRLSLYRGGFDLPAAGHISGAGEDQLKSLVECSLLREAGPGRYQMHGLLQQFSEEKGHLFEKLAPDAAETGKLQEKYSAYYTGWLQSQGARLHTAEQIEVLDRIAAEIENVRSAWRMAFERRLLSQVRAALPVLSYFYQLQSRNQEGRTVFAAAVDVLSAVPGDDETGYTLALLSIHQSLFETVSGNYATARDLIGRCLPVLRLHGQPAEIALAYHQAGSTHFELGEFQLAKEQYEEGLAVLGAQGDAVVRSFLLNGLGDICRVLGEFDKAESHYQGMLSIYEQQGNAWGLARAYNVLGVLAGTRGQYSEAEKHFQQGMETFRIIGDRSGMARLLHNLSILAYIGKDYDKTRRLRLECLEICRQIGFGWGIASELKHLADVEKVMGNYDQARTHYEESLVYTRQTGDRKSAVYALDGLAGLALLQKKLADARRYYIEALNTSLEIELVPLAVDTLCGLAELSAEMNQVEKAAEILSFAMHHPAIDQQTRSKAEALLAGLAEKAPPVALAACQKRGAERTLEEIVRLATE